MKKCIIFSRVSTQEQDLEQQTQALFKEASRLGYERKQCILIEEKESAIKLGIEERRGIQRLYGEIEKDPEIDCILVYETSRISRQMRMIFEVRDYLIAKKIQLVILEPYITLLDKDGNLSSNASLMFNIMSSLAESEMQLKRSRLLRGRFAAREELRYIGGRILLGYKVVQKGREKKIEIDETDANTIRDIFRYYADGKSMVWIAKELMGRGRLNKYNGIDSAIQSIAHILRREEYTGVKCHTYPYPQIISRELWEKVQPLITRNKEKSRTSRHFLLKGLIYNKHNGLCLSGAIRNYCKRGVVNEKAYKVDRLGANNLISLNVPTMDNFILSIIKPEIKRMGRSLLRLEHRRAKEEMEEICEKVSNLEENNTKLENMIAKTERRIIEGKTDESRGDAMILEFRKGIEVNKDLINSYTKRSEELFHYVVDSSLNDIDIDSLDVVGKNEVIKKVIKKIWVSKLENGEYTTLRGKKTNNLLRRLIEIEYFDGRIDTYIYKKISRRAWVEKAKKGDY